MSLILNCVTLSPTPAMQTVGDCVTAVRRHITSVGRHGETAFLFALFGVSEYAQGFCRYDLNILVEMNNNNSLFKMVRMAAIHEGTYMIGVNPESVTFGETSGAFESLSVEGKTIRARFLVTEPRYCGERFGALRRAERQLACALIVADGSIHVAEGKHSFLTVIPPGTVHGWAHPNSAVVLQMDPGMQISPAGKSTKLPELKYQDIM